MLSGMDNFRILLLVGLISVSGIVPAQGSGSCITYRSSDNQFISNTCPDDDKEYACAARPTDGLLVGCVDKNTCGYNESETISLEKLYCNDGAPNCCCLAFNCVSQVSACEQPKLKNLEACKKLAAGILGYGPSKKEGTGTATTFTQPPIGTIILLASMGALFRS